jgi:hypothetical protein
MPTLESVFATAVGAHRLFREECLRLRAYQGLLAGL